MVLNLNLNKILYWLVVLFISYWLFIFISVVIYTIIVGFQKEPFYNQCDCTTEVKNDERCNCGVIPQYSTKCGEIRLGGDDGYFLGNSVI